MSGCPTAHLGGWPALRVMFVMESIARGLPLPGSHAALSSPQAGRRV
jgi:hypothetical protein